MFTGLTLSQIAGIFVTFAGGLATILSSVFAFIIGWRKINKDLKNKEIEALNAKRDELSQAEENFRKSMLDELKSTRDKNETMEELVLKMEKKLDRIELLNHRLNLEKISYESKIKFLQEEIERLKEEITRNEKEIEEQEEEVEKLNQQIEDLEKEIEEKS